MADRMIEIQHQIRQSQSELHSYINDLDTWTSEIKEKELKLKQPSKDSEKEVPPVRNALLKKKKKKVKKEKATEKNSTKIKGSDFRAWDKFDVDKALEEIDAEKSSSSEYETDEEWEEERKKEQAKVHKTEGNDHYKHGRFAEAVECYSRGMQLDPSNPELCANRAQALIKQECYAAAEQDCHAALQLRPGYDKALFRRAKARFELAKHAAARDDLRDVIKLNPQNSEARKLLYKIEEELRPVPERRPGLVVPIYKSSEKRSQRPLRRMLISESGVEDPAAAARRAQERARATQSELTRATLSREEQVFERLAAAPKHEDAAQTEPSKNDPKTNNSSESKSSEAEGPVPDDDLPSIPTSSYQLLQDWRKLKADPLSFYCYFKRIAPRNYSKLLGEGLDADFLSYIIDMLQQHYRSDGDSTLLCLEGLTKAKRFSFTVMFMGQKDKSALEEILAHFKDTHAEKVKSIASVYGIKL